MQDTGCSSGEQSVNICNFCTRRETKETEGNVPRRVATNPNEEISLESDSFKGPKGNVKVKPRLTSDECRSKKRNRFCCQQVNPIPVQQDTDSDHSDLSPQINRPSRRPPKGRKGSVRPGPSVIGIWCLGVATVLIMALLNPASAQATPMPEIEVFDIHGDYSGQTPIVRTVSLINMKECKDLSEIYNNPVTESVQVLRKVNTTGMVFKNGTYGKMMESLYQGEALILKPRNDLNANGSEPTILVIKEAKSHKEVSFSLGRPQAVYGKFMMEADVPGIYIYMLEGQQEPLFVKEKDAGPKSLSKNDTLAAYVTPVPIHNILTPSNTLSQVSLELCNAARHQQLQIMAEMNENSVHFGKARPGVLAKKAGEVVHLLQGIPMKAWLRDDAHGGCYDDIPVRVRTDAETVNLFATPLSLIIKPTSPLVNCSDTPVMFQAKNGDWFSTTKGGLQTRRPPIELTPHSFMWRDKDLGLDWSPTNIREAKKLEVFLHDHAKALEALHHHQHASTFQQNTGGPSTTADQVNKTKSCPLLSRLRRLVKAARTKILEIIDKKPIIMSTNAGRMLVATLALWPVALFVLWLFMHNQIMAARERSTNEQNAYGLQDKILMEKIQENDRRISALTMRQLSLGAKVADWEESTPISHGQKKP
jgi:hypothetical protein